MKNSRDRILEQLGEVPAVRPIGTTSMWPLIRPGDSVRFQRSKRRPRIGETWIAEQGERHLAHRVLLVRGDRVLLKGDWNLYPDGWLPRSALFGPVSEIERAGRWRPAGRLRDRLLGLAASATGTALGLARSLLRRVSRRAGD